MAYRDPFLGPDYYRTPPGQWGSMVLPPKPGQLPDWAAKTGLDLTSPRDYRDPFTMGDALMGAGDTRNVYDRMGGVQGPVGDMSGGAWGRIKDTVGGVLNLPSKGLTKVEEILTGGGEMTPTERAMIRALMLQAGGGLYSAYKQGREEDRRREERDRVGRSLAPYFGEFLRSGR